jgi:hypothetical protein
MGASYRHRYLPGPCRSLMAMTRSHSQYVPNEGSEIDNAKCNRKHEQGFVADGEGPEIQGEREETNASDNERNLSKHPPGLKKSPKKSVRRIRG